MAAVSVFRFENMQPNVIFQPALIIPSNYPPVPTFSEVQLFVTMSFCLNFRRHRCSSNYVTYPVGLGPFYKHVSCWCPIDNPDLASRNLEISLFNLYQELQTDFNFISFEYNDRPKFHDALVKILQYWVRVRVRMTNFITSSSGTIVFPVHAVFSGTVVEHIQEIPPIVQQITNYDEDSTVIYDDIGIGRAMEESALEFERRRYGMVPATESSIKRMLKNVVNVEQGKDCMVCLEELKVGSYVSQMPCSHDFHGDCIETWLKQSHYCPICRFEMPTEEEFN
ncbi:Zinc finger, RING-type [Corchorus olitorius]|uniref:RING-type E3 ubiquitin transferase n=1 Tax=Corchorus olitorius TaxID=93759 RepID=A0A1R3JGM6_9ROSI|nr:Zinc finger, RING-type [Corchorus olitorius]